MDSGPLDLAVDGELGPKTLEAINLIFRRSMLFERLLATRIRFYGEIISKNPSQARFAKGWLKRVTSFLDG